MYRELEGISVFLVLRSNAFLTCILVAGCGIIKREQICGIIKREQMLVQAQGNVQLNLIHTQHACLLAIWKHREELNVPHEIF